MLIKSSPSNVFFPLLILAEVYLFSLKSGVEVLSLSELCRDCKIPSIFPARASGKEESSWLDWRQFAHRSSWACSLQVAAENYSASGLLDLRLDQNSGERDSPPWASWMSRNGHVTSCASVSPVAEMNTMTFLLMRHFKTPKELVILFLWAFKKPCSSVN